MRISTKGRYALRVLIDIAEHENEGYISLNDIAERQGISKKYLEQIAALLNKAGLLRANRGAKGGYKPGKPAYKCTVGEILRITEGSLSPVPCLDGAPGECERSENCPTLPVWQGLSRVINEYLDGITVQDIIDCQRERYANDYSI